ncbi:MAG TPA: hypothetical protein VHI54_00115 [Actinomycetota bacterium]|nr:hypothetical protein [Actinomycetota bacterium]
MAYQQQPGYPAARPTARPLLPGLIAGVVGGALMILGAFLPWVPGAEVNGLEVPIEILIDPDVNRNPDLFVTSAGFLVIVLGLVVILGAALGWGGLPRLAAVLGIVTVALLIISAYRGGANIGDLGLGVWVVLVGSIVALVAGFLAPRSEAGTPV